jgi:hypothetical protein
MIVPVGLAGGTRPVWAPNGRELAGNERHEPRRDRGNLTYPEQERPLQQLDPDSVQIAGKVLAERRYLLRQIDPQREALGSQATLETVRRRRQHILRPFRLR